jgi:hypothetical protein
MLVVAVRGSHPLVQAAEQMPTAVRRGVPGMRVGDQQQVPGWLDDLGNLGRGVPRGGTGPGRQRRSRSGARSSAVPGPCTARPVPGVTRDLPVPGPPVKTRFFHAGRRISIPARLRACSARSTAIRSAIGPVTTFSPGSAVRAPRSAPGAVAPLTAVIVRPALSASPPGRAHR